MFYHEVSQFLFISTACSPASRRPGFDTKSDHVGFVVDKVAMGQVCLAKSLSTKYFILMYQPGLLQYAN
jgi:hypothetical protein